MIAHIIISGSPGTCLYAFSKSQGHPFSFSCGYRRLTARVWATKPSGSVGLCVEIVPTVEFCSPTSMSSMHLTLGSRAPHAVPKCHGGGPVRCSATARLPCTCMGRSARLSIPLPSSSGMPAHPASRRLTLSSHSKASHFAPPVPEGNRPSIATELWCGSADLRHPAPTLAWVGRSIEVPARQCIVCHTRTRARASTRCSCSRRL